MRPLMEIHISSMVSHPKKLDKENKVHLAWIEEMQRVLRATSLMSGEVGTTKDIVKLETYNFEVYLSAQNRDVTHSVGKQKAEENFESSKKKKKKDHQVMKSDKASFCMNFHSSQNGSCSSSTVTFRHYGEPCHKQVDCRSPEQACYNCRWIGHKSGHCPKPKIQGGSGGK